MKRLLVALMACVLLLGCGGCGWLWPDAGTGTESAGPRDTGAYDTRWSYQRLSARLQECYAAMYEAVVDGFGRDETVLVADSQSGTKPREYIGVKVELPRSLLSQQEAKTLYTAFTWDNPQFFYVGNVYGLSGRNTEGREYYDAISLVYTMNAQERAGAQRQLDAVTEEILQDIRPGEYAFSKELTLHDAVAARCTYDEEAAASENPASAYPNAFTVYGALVEGRAVCEGYSRAMQYLLHKVGMECTLVSGSGKKTGVAHMWNLVTVDGRNYHLDVTWDDSEDRLRHNYFNLTTEDIRISHDIDTDNIGVDTCTATEANFFRHSGTYIDTYEKDEIARVIAQQVRLGKTAVEMRFSPETYANAALFFQRPAAVKEKVDALLAEYDLELWEYEIRGEKEEHILSLYKK